MVFTRRFMLALVAAVGSLSGLNASAAPPTDDQIKAAVDAFNKKTAEMRQAKTLNAESAKQAAQDALKGLSLEEASAGQIERAMRLVMTAGEEAQKPVQARLTTLAAKTDAEGFSAAVMALSFIDEDTTPAAQQAAALKAAVRHPAAASAIKDDKATNLFGQLGGASNEALGLIADDLAALEAMVPADASVGVAMGGQMLFRGLVAMGDDHASLRERFRGKFAAIAKAGEATAPEDRKARVRAVAKFFDSNYAKGLLINNPAPELTFAWSSDPSLKSMADLKGKVVVVDFWATWCGPCIASFPNVRELVKHYEGYPVAVIGVTSPQGFHSGKDGRVDTKGDPAKEYSLMPEFMAWREMTWPVVFTEQEVFNPEFGVMGIPHVAIIDAAGKVRYNGLHPARPLDEKTEKIDKLLKEAGLPTPPKG